MKVITIIAIILGLAILSTSCDSQPSYTDVEAIKLAKADAYKIPSPPSIYYIVEPLVGTGGYIFAWPDQPSAKKSSYAICPEPQSVCLRPMTLTTMVNANLGGYDVTFISQWQADSGVTKTHNWLFHIDADRNATFVREEGDTLPPEREGGPLLRATSGDKGEAEP